MSDTTTGVPKKRAKKSEQKAPAAPSQDEQVVRLPLSELHSFKGYPRLFVCRLPRISLLV